MNSSHTTGILAKRNNSSSFLFSIAKFQGKCTSIFFLFVFFKKPTQWWNYFSFFSLGHGQECDIFLTKHVSFSHASEKKLTKRERGVWGIF